MKILIYIEPHPIRNQFTCFSHLISQFIPLLKLTSEDVRIYANTESFKNAEKVIPEDIKKRCIYPTKKEEYLFKSFFKDWYGPGIEDWISLLSGGMAAEAYLPVLQRIYTLFPFDVILYWGENGAISKFVADLPITKIALEFGCTRPPFLNSIVMDPFGSNGNALIPQLSIKDIQEIVHNVPLSAEEALFTYSENIETRVYEQQFLNTLPSEITSKIFNKKRKYVFFPLQLYDDANLLIFSHYNSLCDVVLDVIPKLVESGYMIVIKSHPGCKNRPNAVIENMLAKAAISAWKESIIWCDDEKYTYENAPLIVNADFIITVNSSVGFESLYFNKVVVLLGSALYAPKQLFPSLDDVLTNTFDRDSYFQNIGFLRNFLLNCYLIPSSIFSHSEILYNKICTIDWILRKQRNNVREIAYNYYHIFTPFQQNSSRSRMLSGLTLPDIHDFRPAIMQDNHHNDDCLYIQHLKNCVLELIKLKEPLNKETFLQWLTSSWSDEKSRANIIIDSYLVDSAYYLKKYRDVALNGIDPLKHYLLYGITENRSPCEYVNPASMDELLAWFQEATEVAFEQYESFLTKAPFQEKTNTIDKEINKLSQALKLTNNRIAVVAHFYYKDLVPEIVNYLSNIPEPYDFIVTLPEWGNESIITYLKERFPHAIFCIFPNKGRDIGPFLLILPLLIKKKYISILKIHTKKGFFKENIFDKEYGSIWKKICLESLLRNKESIAAIIDAFHTHPSLNMIGPRQCYLPIARNPYQAKGRLLAQELCSQMSLDNAAFFAGTMFWVRPECLMPLLKKNIMLLYDLLNSGYGNHDALFTHDMERLFGHLAGYQDGEIGVIDFLLKDSIEFNPLPSTQSLPEFLIHYKENIL